MRASASAIPGPFAVSTRGLRLYVGSFMATGRKIEIRILTINTKNLPRNDSPIDSKLYTYLPKVQT